MFRFLMIAIRDARLRSGRREGYRRLNTMDDRMLADIGVTRDDLDRAIRSNGGHFAPTSTVWGPSERRRYTSVRSLRRGQALAVR